MVLEFVCYAITESQVKKFMQRELLPVFVWKKFKPYLFFIKIDFNNCAKTHFINIYNSTNTKKYTIIVTGK